MTVINTNIKSLISQNALIKNNKALESAMEQLSTGKRINSAADDAAGMAVSNRMSAQIRGLDQAVRNANDGISLIQTAEGSLNEVTSMLQRMRELSIQSSNDTNTEEDRGFLDLEFQELKLEINRIAKNTQWNGMDILSKSENAGNGSGKFEFQVGANQNQLISIQLQDFRTDPATPAQPGNPSTVYSSGSVSTNRETTGTIASPFIPAGATQPAVAETPALSQISQLTLSGAYAVGDTIQLDMTVGTTLKTITYTVKSADVDANNTLMLGKIASAIVSEGGIDTTLGVTLTTGTTAGTIQITGTPGQTFTPAVTSTIAAGGKATLQTETAGTATTREFNSITLTGDYKQGDVITIGNGTQTLNYTVKSTDEGTANLATLATSIAAASNGYLANTTVDVTGASIKFTATNFGANTLNLSASVQNASNTFAQTQAAVAYVAAIPASPAVPAVAGLPQKDRLTISGSFDAGDIINVNINNTIYPYTVTASDANDDNPAEAVTRGIALELLDASPAPGVTLDRNLSSIKMTGLADGTPFTSSVTITRIGATTTTGGQSAKAAGSLNMIDTTKILTRVDADTAIENVDKAMAVINESRAIMGAVMNRLTYAGDNLTNVAQNTTESRSRILDADFAKASSELARTQIISQAATAVLAQANQSQQSVLKLLQA
jgi:flagellin